MNIDAYGMQKKNNHSSIGSSIIDIPIRYLSLKPQIPSFVKMMSHRIKINIVINRPGKKFFNLL
tara:strand:+ start:549 stop:740 length:192 start_codon:yes stop_codon:yes gene_type:complete